MAKGFPWYKNIDKYIIDEMNARRHNQVGLTKLSAWLTVTSNLDDTYTLGTETYTSVVGGGRSSFYKTSGDQRFKPNPIITDFTIEPGDRGLLRTGTVKIKCFTLDELTTMQQYFLEPGISVYIQWGWNISLSKGTQIVPLKANSENVNKYYRNYEELEKIRNQNAGCYDSLVGLIVGGSTNMSGDTYEITFKFATNGELLYGVSRNNLNCPEDKSDQDLVYDGDQIEEYTDNKDKYGWKINWVYFFNSLPKEVRTNAIQSLGKLFKPKNYSQFIHYNVDDINDAKDTTTDNWWSWNGKNLNFFGKLIEAQDAQSPVSEKKYVAFSAFIDLLNNSHSTTVDGKKSVSHINISNSYAASFPGIFSPDERVFIPNRECYNFLRSLEYWRKAKPFPDNRVPKETIDNSISYTGETMPTSFPIITTTDIGDGDKLEPDYHGWIGDIYVEASIINSALSNINDPVKDVLDSVLSQMSDAVDGLWQFQVKEEDDELVIVDNNLRNGITDKSNVIHTFNNIGINSDFIGSTFTLEIEKNMMSKVIMEKSAPSGAGNSTDLTGIFSTGKKDTVLIPVPPLKCKDDTNKGDEEVRADEDEKKRKAAWRDIQRYCKLLLRPEFRSISVDAISTFLVPGIFLDKNLFSRVRKGGISTKPGVATESPASVGRPLPVRFEFEVLGISGFKVGHLYRVNGIPNQYNDKGAFQVEKVSHSVQNGKWTTKVDGAFRPFYKNPIPK